MRTQIVSEKQQHQRYLLVTLAVRPEPMLSLSSQEQPFQLGDAALRAGIARELEAMLPPEVVVRVVDAVNGSIDGYTSVGQFDLARLAVDPRTGRDAPTTVVDIALAPSRREMLQVGRHEVIHALRGVDLFTKPTGRLSAFTPDDMREFGNHEVIHRVSSIGLSLKDARMNGDSPSSSPAH